MFSWKIPSWKSWNLENDFLFPNLENVVYKLFEKQKIVKKTICPQLPPTGESQQDYYIITQLHPPQHATATW